VTSTRSRIAVQLGTHALLVLLAAATLAPALPARRLGADRRRSAAVRDRRLGPARRPGRQRRHARADPSADWVWVAAGAVALVILMLALRPRRRQRTVGP